MSRIMIHSNAPWVPSGYGKQCAHLAQTLTALGHEVVISSFCGLTGAPLQWNGITVLPSGQYEYGVDVLMGNMEHAQPDLTIALMDVWKLGPLAEALTGWNFAAWVPVDCAPLSHLDEAFFKASGARPIAMSRFGELQLHEAGLDPLYAPHVVDTSVFKPLEPEQRQKYRQGLGAEDRFVIGLCAANADAVRKGFPEQFEAFRRFRRAHPDAVLWVHSLAKGARGLDLPRLAGELGIQPGAIRITDTYPQISGQFDESFMADWYGMLDVLTQCSYAEAFGVPLIEAQACGTPVVTTSGSAMAEMCGSGWRVAGHPFWNHVHGAWWVQPDIDGIVRAYEKAYQNAARYRVKAAEHALQFDAGASAQADWKEIVEALCG